MDIVVPKDCGNAPRKQTLVDFVIAFVKKDYDKLHDYISDQIEWSLIEKKKQVNGRADFMNEVQSLKLADIVRLQFDYVITHGKTTSVNGVLTFQDGSPLQFNDVIEFSQAGKQGKIKIIKSFWIKQSEM